MADLSLHISVHVNMLMDTQMDARVLSIEDIEESLSHLSDIAILLPEKDRLQSVLAQVSFFYRLYLSSFCEGHYRIDPHVFVSFFLFFSI